MENDELVSPVKKERIAISRRSCYGTFMLMRFRHFIPIVFENELKANLIVKFMFSIDYLLTVDTMHIPSIYVCTSCMFI